MKAHLVVVKDKGFDVAEVMRVAIPLPLPRSGPVDFAQVPFFFLALLLCKSLFLMPRSGPVDFFCFIVCYCVTLSLCVFLPLSLSWVVEFAQLRLF